MSLRRGLLTQMQVVHALILRETRTRFGKNQLGYVWALLEPVLFAAPFLALHSMADRSPPPGMTLFGFLITGVITYLAFRSGKSRLYSAVGGNRGLLFYPQVLPVDLNISRLILESATSLSSFALIMGAEALYRGKLEIDNLLLVLLGFGLASLLGGSLGMVLGALSLYWPTLERITGPMLRPLFWISGVFFTANDLPADILSVLIYNPVLHAVELVRTGWFVDYSSRSASVVYLGGWVLGLMFLGLALERTSRARLEF